MIKYRIFFRRYNFVRCLLLPAFFSIPFIPGDIYQQDPRLKTKKAIEKAGNFLQHIQRADGAICDTANPLFDSWETILAATALFNINPDTNAHVFKRSLSFLRMNENPDKLICHNQKCRAGYCLETTSLYFSLLLKTGDRANVQERLKKIISFQNETGEWEIGNPDVREQKDFPSVTAFVLAILGEAGKEPVLNEQAYDWLLGKQHNEGHWGYGWEYYGCPAYTLWASMKALKYNNSPAAISAKEKAIQYISSRQQENGSWHFIEPKYQKQTSPVLQTTFMLLALQEAGAGNWTVLNKGVNFLLQQQTENGNWDGGYFPIPSAQYIKEEYVLATSLAILVLITHLETGTD
jgi:squalene cyclase